MDNVVSITTRNSAEGRVAAAVANNADKIARALMNGRDIEIRKTPSGISVTEVRKKVLVR